jgi:hypothetical protein
VLTRVYLLAKYLNMKSIIQNYGFFVILVILTVLIVLISCADVTTITECATTEPYGFFSGLWHGFIAPISFIGSLLSDDIALYAVNNTGGWYDLGFVLGAGILLGGTAKAI